jgi:hypothetical protein
MTQDTASHDIKQGPPAAPPKKYRYSPFSTIAAPLSIPIALEGGKALGEAMQWGKGATVVAEICIGGLTALLLAVGINFFFGKEVEAAPRK